jgi:tRNA G46 methylase TrmB
MRVTLTPALAAELYRLTHRGNPGDVGFYRKLCSGVQSVLELGCGYGRLLAALAQPQPSSSTL